MKLKKNVFPAYRGNPLVHLFTIVFLALLAYLVPASFLWNNCDLVDYSLGWVLVCFGAACGAAWGLFRLFSSALCNAFFTKHRLLIVALILAALLPLQYFIAHAVYTQPGWDVSILTENGYWLALNEGLVDHDYFASYPNNITLLMVWAYFFKALLAVGYRDYLLGAIMLCTLMLNAAVWLAYSVADRFCGKAIALTIAVFMVPFLCFAPWIVVPYSDTATILFPILCVWLWLLAQRRNFVWQKIVCYALCGVFAAVGALLKPTVLIVLVAIVLTDLFTLKKSCLLQRLALICACLLCAGGVMLAGQTFNASVLRSSGVAAEKIERQSFPFTHFFNMGLSASTNPYTGGTVYGKWNGDDVVLCGNAPTQAEKIRVTLASAQQKLGAMGAGGYLRYLNDKMRWVMGDGTMYFGGEVPTSPCFVTSQPQQFFQQFLWKDGAYYPVTAHLLQGIWMFVLVLCALPLFLRKQEYDAPALLCVRLCVFGIMLFIALFEGRSRYLTNFLPLFFVLAAYGAALLHSNIEKSVPPVDARQAEN